jgi:hypothetical protein
LAKEGDLVQTEFVIIVGKAWSMDVFFSCDGQFREIQGQNCFEYPRVK